MSHRGLSFPTLLLTGLWLVASLALTNDVYLVDLTSKGRPFDGVGGLSGGGSTSLLLQSYRDPFRSQILDYLFKPKFGASLHILKVEIGGDAQSTDGAESSHMHELWDLNYRRGYEWWLMLEAKKRNPKIKLAALSWAFPSWIAGHYPSWPYLRPNNTVLYTLNWLRGARSAYNLTIDYLGIWNERPYDVDYIIQLRRALDVDGFAGTRIVAADGDWDIVADLKKNAELNKSVGIVGVHYPGTTSPPAARDLTQSLWSSEDYSTYDNNVGAGCLARILNQNYVNGYMTSTILWNLVGSYYDALPFPRSSIMTANEPWSGHYEVTSPLWVTAHTAQFAQPGWYYLAHGGGVQRLRRGGSMVALVSADRRDFTIVFETVTHDHSECVRPPLPAYNVTQQTVKVSLRTAPLKSIVLRPGFAGTLRVWRSQLRFGARERNSSLFVQLPSIPIREDGSFSLTLAPDEIYTVTTLADGRKGAFPTPPPASAPFPTLYGDNFDSYPEYQGANYFAQQAGSFEVRRLATAGRPATNQILVQSLLSPPISWCPPRVSAMANYIGNASWSRANVSVDVQVPRLNGTAAIGLGVRVSPGGCETLFATGVFFWVFPATQRYQITTDLVRSQLVREAMWNVTYDRWYRLNLDLVGEATVFRIDGQVILNMSTPLSKSKKGFVALVTDDTGLGYFDNFIIHHASSAVASGETVLPQN